MKNNAGAKNLVNYQNTATVVLPFNPDRLATPYTENKATAGTIIFLDQEPAIIVHRFDIPFLDYADGGIEVRGKGMEPTYPNGCIIGIIRMAHKEIIDWGHCYFIVDKNYQGTVRRVYPGENQNSLRLVCDNNNQEMFPPIQRKWDHIQTIFLIKSRIFKH